MSDSPKIDNVVRVIVVEDDADDRELLLRQLKKSGIDSHVKFIADGREALDFLTRDDGATLVDELVAIFLDLKLPSLGGIEVLRSIRTSNKLQHLPVIVMTSSNDPQDISECHRLKVSGYVSKPISFTSFSKAVADVFHLPKIEEREGAVP